ncbi:NYN domain-containing protein [Tepidiforma sp.]|uniref:NYN domain-containing protein n=1 Tax=Tepidiforma sp. TaxID=2682230 RepID=UPI002ADD7A29|nr:NYN domain-containing protein [Tepidiforma sp.]
MREAMPGAAQEDVALLVDWENLKFSLMQRNRRVNVTALREAAERFGRVAYARAYADWQDPVQSGDPASLYAAGLEPVYVLTRRYTTAEGEARIQNSVDVKLAADCVEASHVYPNIGTFVIASGDHSFFHVLMLLRARGKRVVVIGVSWATSAQLVQQADVVLYYDLDVDPEGERSGPPAEAAEVTKIEPKVAAAAVRAIELAQAKGPVSAEPREVAEVLLYLLAMVKEFRESGRDLPLSLVGQELQKRMPPAEFQRVAKGRAGDFARALAEQGLVRMVNHDFTDWLYLPGERPETAERPRGTVQELPRYDYARFNYNDLSPEQRREVIVAIHDERNKPGVGWLTFNRILETLKPVVGREDLEVKNLVNSMISWGVLRLAEVRQGVAPDTGASYTYNTFELDLENPEVRSALKLE